MEGLKVRTFVFGAIMLACGAWFLSTKKLAVKNMTEDELIEVTPAKVSGMGFVPGLEDQRVSYRMDEATYKVLAPFGIVARRFTDGQKSFDAVIIASRSKDSFHDPRVCFAAQGWTLEKLEPGKVETKSRGTIPITILEMSSAQARRKLAVFFYKGPGGFYGDTQKLKLGMFWEQFKAFFSQEKQANVDGIFYRFIPDYDAGDIQTQRKELIEFIGEYLDAANESSSGYL